MLKVSELDLKVKEESSNLSSHLGSLVARIHHIYQDNDAVEPAEIPDVFIYLHRILSDLHSGVTLATSPPLAFPTLLKYIAIFYQIL